MRIEQLHAQSRNVSKLDIGTPLIAPSFSSRGFPNVTQLWDELKHNLNGVCLISAYDLATGYLPFSAVMDAGLIILDSGNYEVQGSENEQSRHSDLSWTREAYHETVMRIDTAANIVFVNFDQVVDMETQVKSGLADFSAFSTAASDFLVKPEATDQLTNVSKFSRYLTEMTDVSIIGIAAKEAGDSLLEKCRSVVVLRNYLRGAGLETPIHIFGAVTPYEVLAYFFCGADVFDGLNWLRLAYRPHGAITFEEAALQDENWKLSIDNLRVVEWIANLNFLWQLQQALHCYCDKRETDCLAMLPSIARQAMKVARIAGAEGL